MHCPNCGSPVEIHGSMWECGWCGNCGVVRMIPEVTLSFSFDYHVDLAETWRDLQKTLEQIAPGQALLSELLGKVLIYHISVGIHHNTGALSDEQKAEDLQTFLKNAPDLNPGKSAEEIMRALKDGILFSEVAALSEEDCGIFWAEHFSARRAEDYYKNMEPDGLFELFCGLSSAYACFAGEKGEEMGEAQEYRRALKEAYDIQWRDKVLLHPDAERARKLLAQGKFPDYEDICREILLVEYPEEVPHEDAEDFEELSWAYILEDVFSRDAEKGMEMWRFLLDTAEVPLKTSPETAETLLHDWKWLVSPSYYQKLSLMSALEDERFVSQLFQSAFIGRLQWNILKICRDSGQEQSGRQYLTLALENPCLADNWKKRFERVFSTVPLSGRSGTRSHATDNTVAADVSDDETIYHYCSVQVQGILRPYTYLTGGLPLKVGDWVEIPFGKDGVLQQGQVKSVMDCMRAIAPRPPEQTKTVIRVIDPKP